MAVGFILSSYFNTSHIRQNQRQATHCRQDLEATRQSILSSTRQLGELIGVR